MKHRKWLIAGILILALLLTAGAAGILLPDPATLEQREHLSLLKDAVAGKGEDALWKAVDEMSDEELMALIAEGSAYYQERGESW
ncbi:MAG: hypothetical protein IJF59_00980, partial [Clostridia bacterium]|nr:hypothetical protein [Clostridia bacterium]